MKKLEIIAGKTGLEKKEISKFFKIGFWGLAGFVMMGLAGCFKNGTEKPPAEKPKEAESTAGNVEIPQMEDVAGQFETERSTAAEESETNCGPYPGYPCGTKYYAISISDFK